MPPPSPIVEEGDATAAVAEEIPRPPSPDPINPNEVHEPFERAAWEPIAQRSPSPVAIRVEMPKVAPTPSAVETPLPRATTAPVKQPEVVDATPTSSFQPIFQRPPATTVDPSTTEQNASDASPPSVGGFPNRKPMEVLKKLQLRRQQSSDRAPSTIVPVELSSDMAASLK